MSYLASVREGSWETVLCISALNRHHRRGIPSLWDLSQEGQYYPSAGPRS
eukprot:gene883-1711_t